MQLLRRYSFLVGVGAIGLAACSEKVCDQYPDLCVAGAGGTGSTGSTGPVAGSTSTGIPSGCELVDGQTIPAECGVFVKAGAAGTGSRTDPFGSIVDAVNGLGAAKVIYVCGGDTFNGSVTLASGNTLFGGLDCATWTFAASNPHAKVLGDANTPAVTLSDGGSVTAMDSVDAEAVDATTAGASSIAVFVQGGTADVKRASFKAGRGAQGAAADLPTNPPGQAASGHAGVSGCGAASSGDGQGGLNTCGVDDVGGGLGGGGSAGGMGGNGNAGGPASTGGTGGTGQLVTCNVGGQGGNGGVGTPGLASTETGTIDGSGFSAAIAPDAMPGTHGLGGGGGGGGKKCSTNAIGPGAGGGGAGGCGGAGGHGGKGGGGSFTVVSFNAQLTLTDAKLTSSLGGAGGVGGDGQSGQLGGDSGLKGANNGDAVSNACSGGPGGAGGAGGPGAGGNGGPSAPIAKKGGAVTRGGVVDDVGGVGGAGGTGSNNAGTTPSAPKGTTGLACSTLDFDTSACG